MRERVLYRHPEGGGTQNSGQMSTKVLDVFDPSTTIGVPPMIPCVSGLTIMLGFVPCSA